MPAVPRFQSAFDGLARLIDLARESSRLRRGDPKQWEAAARDCLGSLLESLEGILKSAPAGRPLRMFLGAMIRATPVKEYLEEDRDGLLHHVLRSSAISPSEATWLNYDCGYVGDELGHARRILSGSLARLIEKIVGDLPAQEPEREGPVEAGLFLWKGKRYPFSRRQWLLLKELWQRTYQRAKERVRGHGGRGPGVQIEEEYILAMVYEDRDASSNTLWQLQKRTQDKLNEYRLPFEICRPQPLMMQLRMRQPLTRS